MDSQEYLQKALDFLEEYRIRVNVTQESVMILNPKDFRMKVLTFLDSRGQWDIGLSNNFFKYVKDFMMQSFKDDPALIMEKLPEPDKFVLGSMWFIHDEGRQPKGRRKTPKGLFMF
jgi:hypothetical protein